MDFRKIALYAAIVIVALFLWNAWQREFPATTGQTTATTTNSTQSTTASNTAGTSAVPTIPKGTSNHQAQSQTAIPQAVKTKAIAAGQFIHVKTDVLDILINVKNGEIDQAKLLKYPVSLKTPKQKMALFNTNPDTYYVAKSGLAVKQGDSAAKGISHYTAAKTQYDLTTGQKELLVPLHWRNAQGVMVTKTYVFQRGSYTIGMHYNIVNQSSTPWSGYVYTQLARKQPPKHKGSFLSSYANFNGAAISSPAEHYQKLKFKNFASEPVNKYIQGGWAAMIQQYFLSAWVPPATQKYYYASSVNNGVYTLSMVGPTMTVQPKQTLATQDKLYVGPAIASSLNALSPHLSMAIDYGWLWFISKIIFWVMKLIHHFVGNWGWSIILTTIVIKLLFYPLSDKSFRSMAKMRKLQPRMAKLKERHGGDRQAMSKATMEMYRKEKVNPLGGCLPIVIQIPVFIALYWVIMQSVELYQAPWWLWIKDLSVHDPYYILPVLMGGLMFVQQKLSPPPPDPTQAKVMMFMPVIFTVFFLQFASGLVLYWVTNTLVTILHQYYVIRRVERQDKLKKHNK